MIEKRNRIRASLFAYAYEIMDDPLISDLEYDALCLKIDPVKKTGHAVMDKFFQKEFSPDTGMWIYKHPEWRGIAQIYRNLTGRQPRHIPEYQPGEITTHHVNNLPFKTHFEMMTYLASLGFRVVGGRHIGATVFDYEFDKDFMTLNNVHTGESKTVFYKDIYG